MRISHLRQGKFCYDCFWITRIPLLDGQFKSELASIYPHIAQI